MYNGATDGIAMGFSLIAETRYDARSSTSHLAPFSLHRRIEILGV
jgi:hypothetical protein